MNNTSEKLTKAPLTKLMFSLSIPTIVAQLINILYNIVDRMYVGRMADVGSIALTGLGVCAPIITIVSSLSMLIGGGGAPLAAISLGAKDKNKAEKILGTSTFALLVMGLGVTVLFLIFKEPLLIAFGASEASLPYASTYLEIYLYGTIFVQLSLGLNSFISSQGKTMVAMLSVLIGAILNIILDPILIYTFNMGVAGAAWATIISQFVSAIFVFSFLASSKSEIRIKKEYVKFNAKLIGSISALGVSSFVMSSTEAAIVIIFNRSLIKYGSDMHVGAMAIIQSVVMMVFMPVSGFKQGILPIISYNYGANNIKRVRETVIKALTISWSFTAIFCLFIYLFPQVFASVFTSDPALVNIVREKLPIFFAGMWWFGIQDIAQGYFVGTNKPKLSLFIALLRKVIVLIPLAIILPKFIGVDGVYLSEPIADYISVSTSAFILFRHLKRMGKENC